MQVQFGNGDNGDDNGDHCNGEPGCLRGEWPIAARCIPDNVSRYILTTTM